MDSTIIFATDPENAPASLYIKQRDNLFEVFAEVRGPNNLSGTQGMHLATYSSLEEAKSFAHQKRYIATKSLHL